MGSVAGKEKFRDAKCRKHFPGKMTEWTPDSVQKAENLCCGILREADQGTALCHLKIQRIMAE
jgi:hypothetical protein